MAPWSFLSKGNICEFRHARRKLSRHCVDFWKKFDEASLGSFSAAFSETRSDVTGAWPFGLNMRNLFETLRFDFHNFLLWINCELILIANDKRNINSEKMKTSEMTNGTHWIKTVSLTSRQLLASMHYIFIIEDWMIAIFTIKIQLLQRYPTRVNMYARRDEKKEHVSLTEIFAIRKVERWPRKTLKKQKALERVKVYDFLVGFVWWWCHVMLAFENIFSNFELMVNKLLRLSHYWRKLRTPTVFIFTQKAWRTLLRRVKCFRSI